MKHLIMTDYNGEEINLTEEFNLKEGWYIVTDGRMNDLEVVEWYLEWQDLTILELGIICDEHGWGPEAFNVEGLRMVDVG